MSFLELFTTRNDRSENLFNPFPILSEEELRAKFIENSWKNLDLRQEGLTKSLDALYFRAVMRQIKWPNAVFVRKNDFSLTVVQNNFKEVDPANKKSKVNSVCLLVSYPDTELVTGSNLKAPINYIELRRVNPAHPTISYWETGFLLPQDNYTGPVKRYTRDRTIFMSFEMLTKVDQYSNFTSAQFVNKKERSVTFADLQTVEYILSTLEKAADNRW